LVGSPEGKRELGRPRSTWENNIKNVSSSSGMGRHGLDSYDSGYGQMAGTCECGKEPSRSIKCGKFPD